MFVTAVLSPDPAAFVGWCRSRGYRVAGDGAESTSGKWLAVRVLDASDLRGLEVDRVDYALDFWRRLPLEEALALEALAFACRRRARPTTPGRLSPRGAGSPGS